MVLFEYLFDLVLLIVDMEKFLFYVIFIEKGDFGWDVEKFFIFSDIILIVLWCQLIMVVGLVGCGKFILFQFILGEIFLLLGFVYFGLISVVYCF